MKDQPQADLLPTSKDCLFCNNGYAENAVLCEFCGGPDPTLESIDEDLIRSDMAASVELPIAKWQKILILARSALTRTAQPSIPCDCLPEMGENCPHCPKQPSNPRTYYVSNSPSDEGFSIGSNGTDFLDKVAEFSSPMEKPPTPNHAELEAAISDMNNVTFMVHKSDYFEPELLIRSEDRDRIMRLWYAARATLAHTDGGIAFGNVRCTVADAAEGNVAEVIPPQESVKETPKTEPISGDMLKNKPRCVGCYEEKSPIHFLPGKDLYLCRECNKIIADTFEQHEPLELSEAQPPQVDGWMQVLEFYADEDNFNTDTEGNLHEAHESPIGPFSFRKFGYRARKALESQPPSTREG